MRAGSKWCSICRATYRGSYSVHAGTTRHRRLARGPADSQRRLGTKRRSYHIPKADTGQDYDRVHRYRRRRPLDGPRRVVKVAAYWRHKVQRWIRPKYDW